MKIGRRLKQLEQMVSGDYQQIWDCCCDHGLLGMLLLKRQAAAKVHFVDIAAPIMRELKHKLTHFFPALPDHSGNCHSSSWKVHCQDVADIDLAQTSQPQARQLIIIAGVGGERVIELVDAITRRHPDYLLEFLLCPVHHNFQLRESLIQWRFGLIDEQLVEENGRFYELIHVSRQATRAITKTGSILWDFHSKPHRTYLQKTLAFYQRNARDPKKSVAPMLEAYQQLSTKFHIE